VSLFLGRGINSASARLLKRSDAADRGRRALCASVVPLLGRLAPKLQRGSSRDALEVIVGGKHRQVVAQAKLCQQRIDGADLNTGAPAVVSQLGRLDMILPVWDDQWQGGKPIKDLRACFGTRKSLQKLLQDESGCERLLARFNCAHEGADIRRCRRVAPQR
jgi:hypothetical protein